MTEVLNAVTSIILSVARIFAAVAFVKFCWKAFHAKGNGNYLEAIYTMSKAIVMFIAALHL